MRLNLRFDYPRFNKSGASTSKATQAQTGSGRVCNTPKPGPGTRSLAVSRVRFHERLGGPSHKTQGQARWRCDAQLDYALLPLPWKTSRMASIRSLVLLGVWQPEEVWPGGTKNPACLRIHDGRRSKSVRRCLTIKTVGTFNGWRGTGWPKTPLLQLKTDLTHLSKPSALRHPLVCQGEIYKKDSAEEYRTFKHMNERDKIRVSTIAETASEAIRKALLTSMKKRPRSRLKERGPFEAGSSPEQWRNQRYSQEAQKR